jgi:radical SAM protein with 4Fe4S-binding SPASM domain
MSFNRGDVRDMVEFADYYGARVVNFFFMVCTGRGEKLTDITPEQYEEALSTLIDLQAKYPGMMIRARCAPHFKRIAYQKDPHSPITKAEGYMGGGCLAGSHYCRIAPDGEVTPCPYMPLSVGNVRDERFPEIWENAPVFKDLRGWQLKGKCGECEFEDICGGCRARPYASHGDYLDEDLWCQYTPQGGEKIGVEKMSEEDNMVWTREAEERLNRLPFFLRSMIKGNVEKYAKGHGISSITPELLDELKKRRFGDKMPDMPPGEGRSQKLEVRSQKAEGFVNPLPWTKEALRRLDAIPDFMQGIFKDVAEEFARDKGHLEVNVEVWDRLEEIGDEKLEVRSKGLEVKTEGEAEKGMEWTEDVLFDLEGRYSGRQGFAGEFMVGLVKEDIEREAISQGFTRIDKGVLERIESQGKVMVEWAEDAWERLQKAPDFIRSGIKKAAERRARIMGVTLITSELLTQFRNMAMMKAVKRIKALGYSELSFDAFDEAKQKFKNIKENIEAQERLDEIRAYVTSKGNIGLIDKEMLKKMKEYLNT